MRWSRRATRVSLRLLWRLLLVIFNAHLAAPNSPVWHGLSGYMHHSHSSELALIAVHTDHQSHCELCSSSAFQADTTLSGVPRAAFCGSRAAKCAVSSSVALGLRLPEAHAPPRA